MKRTVCGFLTVILFLMFVLTGCQGKVKVMDFKAPLELKTPEKKASKKPTILLIGNNYTYYNDMPAMLKELSLASGYEPYILDRSKAYYSLEKFANEEDLMGAAIQKDLYKKWDYVVLQDHTNMAALPDGYDRMLPYAQKLAQDIQKSGAQTILFMTWGGKRGATLPMDKGSIQLNAGQMHTLLAENYLKLSNELDSLLVPAGVAFMRCEKENPKLELWDSDGQHPSKAGSYLAACLFYAVIYQETPVGNSYVADLDEQTALTLQTLAQDIVLGQ